MGRAVVILECAVHRPSNAIRNTQRNRIDEVFFPEHNCVRRRIPQVAEIPQVIPKLPPFCCMLCAKPCTVGQRLGEKVVEQDSNCHYECNCIRGPQDERCKADYSRSHIERYFCILAREESPFLRICFYSCPPALEEALRVVGVLA